MQYLFLNGRFIRDRSLQHALGEAYRGLLLTGRYPICFLQLDMPPELVDVNVHPTKLEVRFQDGGRLYSQLLGTLRTKFLTTDLTARGDVAADGGHGEPMSDEPTRRAGASELVAVGQASSWATASARREPSRPIAAGDAQRRPADEPLRLHRIDVPPLRSRSIAATARSRRRMPTSRRSRDATHAHAAAMPRRRERCRFTTAIWSPRPTTGMVVIDQHALHERILYEQLREKVLGRALESQRLLVPEPVDLAASEAAAVLEQRELLAQLGVEVEPFGGETVLVSSYPAMLANFSPAEVLRELVEQLLAGGKQPEARDLLDELLHMIACKAAVKSGDRLTPEEIDALLAAAAPGPGPPPLPARPADGAGVYPRRTRPAVQADLIRGRFLGRK